MKVDGQHHRSIVEDGESAVLIVDQSRLPFEFALLRLDSSAAIVDAITTMKLRGAPLIGVAGAYALALGLRDDSSDANLAQATTLIGAARPTAVNLRWALARVARVVAPLPAAARAAAAWREARAIAAEDVELNRALGRHGAALLGAIHQRLQRPVNILTHCNAGWIATVDFGTAMSALYQAHDAGTPLHVWVDETRPRNQGLLTAWELGAHGVPHTLITDNAGGHLMQQGEVDLVLVGADRVSAQGDVCNKIGTYLKALAALDNGVPFYAAVPSPTIDWALRDARAEIPIEQRAADEVRRVAGLDAAGAPAFVAIASERTPVGNPAFDVTPARLVTGIITERGVAAPGELLGLFPEQRAAA